MNACISQVRRFSITLVVLILLSVPAFPADAGTNQAERFVVRPAMQNAPRSTPGVSLWRSLGALLLVVGGFVAVTRVLKNRYPNVLGSGPERRVKVLERMVIDQRRSLLLVSFDNQELLLGVGTDGITTLHSAPLKSSPDSMEAS